MIRLRPLPLLSALGAAAFGLLLLLGQWQWGRFREKLALAQAPAAAVAFAPAGQGRAVFVYAVLEGRPGWRVFAPVQAEAGLVFADVAFVPGLALPQPGGLPLAQPGTGVWLAPRPPSLWRARPQPQLLAFYALDLPEMAQAAGAPLATDRYIAAEYGPAPNPFAAQRALGPERHFGYALTWWGLAGGLVLVYLAYHHQAGRLRWGRA